MGDGSRESFGSLLDVEDVVLSEESSDESEEEAPRKRRPGLSTKESKAASRKERIARIKRENARYDGARLPC